MIFNFFMVKIFLLLNLLTVKLTPPIVFYCKKQLLMAVFYHFLHFILKI